MTTPLDDAIANINTNVVNEPKAFAFNTTFATGDLLEYQGKLYIVDVGGGTSSSGLAPSQWPHDASSTHTLYGDDDQVIMASTISAAVSAGATVVSGNPAGTDDFGTAWSTLTSPFTSSAYTSSDPVPTAASLAAAGHPTTPNYDNRTPAWSTASTGMWTRDSRKFEINPGDPVKNLRVGTCTMSFAGYASSTSENDALASAAKSAAETAVAAVTISSADAQTFGAKDSEGNPTIEQGSAVTTAVTNLKTNRSSPAAQYALAVLNTAKTQLDSKLP